MRANFSQVSSATAGQVVSHEPRPTSTSRQPDFPLRSPAALNRNKTRSSRTNPRSVRSRRRGDSVGTAQAAGKAEQQHGAIAQVTQVTQPVRRDRLARRDTPEGEDWRRPEEGRGRPLAVPRACGPALPVASRGLYPVGTCAFRRDLARRCPGLTELLSRPFERRTRQKPFQAQTSQQNVGRNGKRIVTTV